MANPKADILANAWGSLIQQHHAAFAVELLGKDRAGVSGNELQELLEKRLIDPSRLGGLTIPGMRNKCDPFMFAQMVARIAERAPAPMRREMRQWSLPKWADLVDAEIDRRWESAQQGKLPLGASIRVEQPQLPAPPPPAPAPTLPATYLEPIVAIKGQRQFALPLAAQQQQLVPVTQHALEQPKVWLSPAEFQSWSQATTRAGEYCRGLGNRTAADLQNVVAEAWQGEDIQSEVRPAERARKLEKIKQMTADALASHKDARKLARDLAFETKDWDRNWERIARTEIQGAYSDGKVVDAIFTYGEATRVARMPNSGCCDHCRAAFLGPNGAPRVFGIRELIANGTNVGRPAAQWKATLWPLHPNCECDTIIVPPGMSVDSSGRLFLSKEKNDGI
uniref:Uncharacterized protein n=1 Tax=uncultured Caudovirales phage TaxID=2100421 RepID=A0A6J5LA56_9CAUD|nr:hypothetical protein UFOVP114_61 [uncultured Caudovirales phage]